MQEQSEHKAKICYPVQVRRCTVSIRGKDGELHTKTVDATSLFDAADEVIRDWNRLWWWSSSSLIEIESGPDRSKDIAVGSTCGKVAGMGAYSRIRQT